MASQWIKLCIENGILVNPEVANLFQFLSDEDVKTILDGIKNSSRKILTKETLIEQVSNLIHPEKSGLVEKIRIHLGITLSISKTIEKIDYKEENQKRHIIIRRSYANKAKKIAVEDFVKHFRNRVVFLREVLRQRSELTNLVSISKMPSQRQQVSIIGIVTDKRVSKSKNIILEVEDLTGKTAAIISQYKPELAKIAKSVLLDDVIAIKGIGDSEKIYPNDIYYPDSFLQEKANLDRNESAAFISDIHVGSANFLKEQFLKFIDWLNGNVGDKEQREEALRIKWLFITGDTVDGIGVFPGQEKLLTILDIKNQYDTLAGYLNKIRKDVTMVLCPGQHDAVRVAEPQPVIPKIYAEALYGIDNLYMVSNPALIEIQNSNAKNGVKVLMYHGASFHGFISEIEELRVGKAMNYPTRIVKHVLKRRHLAPTHSLATYIPDSEEDFLVIREVPDILTTGDLHRPEVDTYNGVMMIACSCWQSITQFEEKVGNSPDPCKVPVMNLNTRDIKVWDFSQV